MIRPYSHSLSDDERLYRPDAERQADAARDPVPRMQMFLLREGILDEKGINKIEKEVEEQFRPTPTARSKPRCRSPTRFTTSSTRPISIPPRRLRTQPAFAAACGTGCRMARKLPLPKDHGRLDQRHAARRDAARRADRHLRRRCRRRQPRRISEAEAGQRARAESSS